MYRDRACGKKFQMAAIPPGGCFDWEQLPQPGPNALSVQVCVCVGWVGGWMGVLACPRWLRQALTRVCAPQVVCATREAGSKWTAMVYASDQCIADAPLATVDGQGGDACVPLQAQTVFALRVRCDRALVRGRVNATAANEWDWSKALSDAEEEEREEPEVAACARAPCWMST